MMKGGEKDVFDCRLMIPATPSRRDKVTCDLATEPTQCQTVSDKDFSLSVLLNFRCFNLDFVTKADDLL